MSSLEALRETQLEQGTRIAALQSDLENLRTEMTARFDQVSGGLDSIVGMLNRLLPDEDQQRD